MQLYTVRDRLATDRPGTLKALADFGYTAVEAYDVITDPERLRDDLAEAGLAVCATHAPVLGGDAGRAWRGARVVGADTVFVPYQPPERFTGTDAVRQLAAELNEAARRAADEGLRLGYHNHDFELSSRPGGRAALRVLADELAPGVLLEVDTYWAAVGGEDVPGLLRALDGGTGRVTHLHVKDGPITKDDPMTAVGAGRMPVAAVLDALPGVEWHVVELDHCATDVLAAVGESHAWLTSRGAR
ncbi:sugar phosphate isomerase/epimerase [Streptomyces capparidis]